MLSETARLRRTSASSHAEIEESGEGLVKGQDMKHRTGVGSGLEFEAQGG